MGLICMPAGEAGRAGMDGWMAGPRECELGDNFDNVSAGSKSGFRPGERR